MSSSGGSSSKQTAEQQQQPIDVAQHLYTFDEAELDALRKAKPWQISNDRNHEDAAKNIRTVSVAPPALFKILSHCQSGVDKGRRNGSNPIEVMGLLLGRPHAHDLKKNESSVSDSNTENNNDKNFTRLVVTDAFPLPIEGFETRVVADDDHVQNHMIQLTTCLELTRKEKVCGWYHSHPFDYSSSSAHSHCFLSSTDISTQLLWQRSEDPQGNPFVAIVVDPLRSLAKNRPELKAFRCYPPEYSSAVPNECPDGSIIADEQQRIAIWGAAWNRYYELDVEYFMSRSAGNVMSKLTESFLWMRTLSHTPLLEREKKERFSNNVCSCADKMKNLKLSIGAWDGPSPGANTTAVSSGDQGSSKKVFVAESLREEGDFNVVCKDVNDLTTEQIYSNVTQVVKGTLFG